MAKPSCIRDWNLVLYCHLKLCYWESCLSYIGVVGSYRKWPYDRNGNISPGDQKVLWKIVSKIGDYLSDSDKYCIQYSWSMLMLSPDNQTK